MTSRLGLPLSGVRVLDLTQVWAGTKATLMLASLGAEIVKVEAPSRPDPVRGAKIITNPDSYPGRDPGARPYNRASTFNTMNRGKLGITLDLRAEAGMALFKRLVAVSDVVAENYSATVMARLGIDYESLRTIKPDIIMLSMPGFGATGPERDYISWADIVEAAGGFARINGYAGGGPMPTIQAFPDPFAGIFGAGAILTALRHRRRTGRGQYIELSQHEALINFMAEPLLDYQMNGRIMEPRGDASPHLAPHGVYPCKGEDSWIAVAVEDDAAWQSLCGAMGSPSWATDPELATLTGRLRSRQHVDDQLAKWTARHSADALMGTLQAAGVSAGRVQSTALVAADPHLRERGILESVTHPEAGTHDHHRPLSFRFASTAWPPTQPSPRFGEHNERVLGGILGLSESEIAALAADGVIADAPDWEAKPVLANRA